MMKKAIQVLAIIAISAAVSYAVFQLTASKERVVVREVTNSPPNRFMSMPEGADISPMDFTFAAELTVNTVVHVKTEMMGNAPQDPFYYFFYGRPMPPQIIKASGSGVIISADGYIVTNNHVIDKAENIEVVLNDKQSYKADVIGQDPNTDLALLKIDASQLPFVTYGNSDDTKVGEWVLAVGNPFNLTSTVTAGIVSAKGRDINILGTDMRTGASAIESFIQTDAAVNPGNSGGALVNVRGELVGINSAIQSSTGAYVGYSFAIPVNIVKKVVNDLKEYGTVQRAFIGVNIMDIDKSLADKEGLKDLNGVYVSGVVEKGAAEEAGIEEGDVIVRVGNVEINRVPQLQEQIGQFRPGDVVMITLKREGKEMEKKITLKNYKGNTEMINRDSEAVLKTLGARFEKVAGDEMEKLGIEGGAKVVQLFSGKLMRAGVQEGFIITRIDKREVNEPEDVFKILEGKKGGVLIEGVYPNGKERYYGFGME